MAKVWSSGWNVPGYPCDHEPYNCATWSEAAIALHETLAQAYEQEGNVAEAQLYLDAMDQLIRAELGANFSARVGNYVWWVQEIELPE